LNSILESEILTVFWQYHFLQIWCNFTCLYAGKITCHHIEKFLQFGVISRVLNTVVKFSWILIRRMKYLTDQFQ